MHGQPLRLQPLVQFSGYIKVNFPSQRLVEISPLLSLVPSLLLRLYSPFVRGWSKGKPSSPHTWEYLWIHPYLRCQCQRSPTLQTVRLKKKTKQTNPLRADDEIDFILCCVWYTYGIHQIIGKFRERKSSWYCDRFRFSTFSIAHAQQRKKKTRSARHIPPVKN